MPIYEYKCNNCSYTFEEFQFVGAGNEKLICPKCKTAKPEKLFSAFASSSGNSGSVSAGSGCNSSSPFT